jgi:hypothetical protein
MIGTALLGLGVGMGMHSGEGDDALGLAVFVAVFAALFSFAIFAVLAQPIQVDDLWDQITSA